MGFIVNSIAYIEALLCNTRFNRYLPGRVSNQGESMHALTLERT